MRGRSGHDKAFCRSRGVFPRVSAFSASYERVGMTISAARLLTHPARPDLSNPSMANRQGVNGGVDAQRNGLTRQGILPYKSKHYGQCCPLIDFYSPNVSFRSTERQTPSTAAGRRTAGSRTSTTTRRQMLQP